MIEGALLFAEIALFAALLLTVKRMARKDRPPNMGLFSYLESGDDVPKTKTKTKTNTKTHRRGDSRA
jgi:hypothetical protein